MNSEHILDLRLLENVIDKGDIIHARCPACALDEADRSGNHLAIFADGKFGCAAHPRDRDHNRKIIAVAGFKGAGQRTQRCPAKEPGEDHPARIIRAATINLPSILERYADPEDSLILKENHHILWELYFKCGPVRFLSALYHPDAILWTGEIWNSGNPRHTHRWKPLSEWSLKKEPIGPLVAPGIWPPGTLSRSKSNVIGAPYVVLDFDEIDGIKPETPEGIQVLQRRSIAIIRWIRAELNWNLAAIVQTGHKSLHAWFHTPPLEVLQSIKPIAKILGVDPCLIDNPAQPCRLPMQRHHKTGNLSRVFWLQDPAHRVPAVKK
jgi:hypothetical protein